MILSYIIGHHHVDNSRFFLTLEKHRVDFSSFSSDNKFPELLSTREATVEGDGADTNMNVLSIQGNSKIKFATTREMIA